jgi:hypothetical protein
MFGLVPTLRCDLCKGAIANSKGVKALFDGAQRIGWRLSIASPSRQTEPGTTDICGRCAEAIREMITDTYEEESDNALRN